MWFKKKQKVIDITPKYCIKIILKSGRIIVLESEHPEAKKEFANINNWFLFRKSSGYLLDYNKGSYSLLRENIDYIHVYNQ